VDIEQGTGITADPGSTEAWKKIIAMVPPTTYLSPKTKKRRPDQDKRRALSFKE